MFRKKIITQPSVRHALFAKEKNHALKVCKYKKMLRNFKTRKWIEEGVEIFMLNTPTKTRERVKINGKYFHMQVDTGSDITLIPANFWQDLGKLELKKSTLQLKQFDGIMIKT